MRLINKPRNTCSKIKVTFKKKGRKRLRNAEFYEEQDMREIVENIDERWDYRPVFYGGIYPK